MGEITMEIRYANLDAFVDSLTENGEVGRILYLDLQTIRTSGPLLHLLVLAGYTERTAAGTVMHRIILNCGSVLSGLPLGEQEESKKAQAIVKRLHEVATDYGWVRRSAILLFPGEKARDW